MSAPFDLETGPPSAELLEVARKELRETPEVRAAAIEELRKLLQASSDLSFPDDDDFLLFYLRPTHFYPESAIKLVSHLDYLPLRDNQDSVYFRCAMSPSSKKLTMTCCII